MSNKTKNPQYSYTTIEKDIILISEYLNLFHGIIFGYEINVYLDHNNLVYADTKSEYQRVMCWIIIIKEFWTNIQHIDGAGNILSDTISRFPSTNIDR